MICVKKRDEFTKLDIILIIFLLVFSVSAVTGFLYYEKIKKCLGFKV